MSKEHSFSKLPIDRETGLIVDNMGDHAPLEWKDGRSFETDKEGMNGSDDRNGYGRAHAHAPPDTTFFYIGQVGGDSQAIRI